MKNDATHIFSELQTSIAEALRRSEEHMSHVQRQLAGWQTHTPKHELPDQEEGWQRLLAQIEEMTGNVDQELAQLQEQLNQLISQGRAWKQTAAANA
jgi:hypothetical protein